MISDGRSNWVTDRAYLEGTQETLVHAHHGACIVKLPAVVRCAEQRDQLPLGEEFVTVLDDLVRAADEIHIVFLKESRDDVGTEGERYTAVIFAPARDVLVGVGPQEIAEKTAIRDLSLSADQP